jgi:hypothetical protein
MSRPKRWAEGLDVALEDLPQGARWRQWSLRVEAAIFAATSPVLSDRPEKGAPSHNHSNFRAGTPFPFDRLPRWRWRRRVFS